MNIQEHRQALREKAGPMPDRRTKRRRSREARRRAAIEDQEEEMERYMQEYRDAYEADTYNLRDALRVEEEDEPTTPADRLDALEARVAKLEMRLDGVIENHSLWDGS